MHHTDTVRIATNPRKWRRPAPCPACRKSRPLILTLGTALAGCGSASEPSTPAHAVKSIESQCSDMDDDFSECVITLTDTRQVDCVVYSGYKQGGLSCDWRHVSGADKEPAR